MARIADDPFTQQWWSIMMPMQRSLRSQPDEPWWTELPEVFHLD
jgi:L-rhamnose mutarotase